MTSPDTALLKSHDELREMAVALIRERDVLRVQLEEMIGRHEARINERDAALTRCENAEAARDAARGSDSDHHVNRSWLDEARTKLAAMTEERDQALADFARMQTAHKIADSLAEQWAKACAKAEHERDAARASAEQALGALELVEEEAFIRGRDAARKCWRDSDGAAIESATVASISAWLESVAVGEGMLIVQSRMNDIAADVRAGAWRSSPRPAQATARRIRVAFDIGGVLSKYPDTFRPLMRMLVDGGAEVYVLTDRQPTALVIKVLAMNGFDFIAPGRVISADFTTHAEGCKAHVLSELAIDVMFDDHLAYLADPACPVRCLVLPDTSKPYTAESWEEPDGAPAFGHGVYRPTPPPPAQPTTVEDEPVAVCDHVDDLIGELWAACADEGRFVTDRDRQRMLKLAGIVQDTRRRLRAVEGKQ